MFVRYDTSTIRYLCHCTPAVRDRMMEKVETVPGRRGRLVAMCGGEVVARGRWQLVAKYNEGRGRRRPLVEIFFFVKILDGADDMM